MQHQCFELGKIFKSRKNKSESSCRKPAQSTWPRLVCVTGVGDAQLSAIILKNIQIDSKRTTSFESDLLKIALLKKPIIVNCFQLQNFDSSMCK